MILLILFLLTAQLFPQEYNFIKYDVKSGLAVSQISQINNFDDGRLIISTYGGGLNIYNGQKFITLNTTTGFCSDNIYSLAKFNDNLIWLGTEKGLIKLEYQVPKNYFIKNGLPSNLIWSLAKGSKEVLWIGTNKGLAKFENGKIEVINNELVNGQQIWSLFYDSNNILWIGLLDRMVQYNTVKNEFIKRNEYKNIKAVHAFKKDKNGNIWIGTDDGLYKVKNKKVLKFTTKDGLSSNLIWSIYIDSKNDIWLGTEIGVTLLSKNKFIKIGKNEGLVDYRVWTVKEDLEKNIWIGSDEGLYKLTDMSFRIYRQIFGKPVDAWSILEKSKNEYWVGLELEGVVLLKNNRFQKLNDSFKFRGSSSFLIDKDKNFWFGNSFGIYRSYFPYYNKAILEYDKITEPVTNIIQNQKGEIFFSTVEDGIIKFDGKNFKKKKEDIVINYIYLDSSKRFWVGTSNGLKIKRGDSLIVPKGLEWTNNLTIVSIIEDKKGIIWFGSAEEGLFSLNTKISSIPQIDTISVLNGLNNNSVMGTTLDDDENLWVATNGGINKIKLNNYHKNGEKKVISYDLNDGITGAETFQNGIFTDSQNNIFVGTIDGLLFFNSKNIKENKRPPVTKITSIKILDKDFNEINVSNSDLKKVSKTGLELSYNQNNLTINFVGISLTNPQKVKYSYKLNNNKWSLPQYEAKAYFPNLQYGTYTFQVISANNHGVWSKNPTILKFKITAPLWRKLWFQILAVLLFIMSILIIYSLRLRKINKVNRDLEERIAERIKYETKLLNSEKELKAAKEAAEKSDKLKSEFLAQMSHEIRTPLNSILNFSNLLKDELIDKVEEPLKESFSIIESSGRRLIRTIDSVLGMSQIQTNNLEINKKKLNLCDILNELYLEFAPLAENKHIGFSIICKTKDCIVYADQYTITQMIANLIDNAIKYTNSGKVDVKVEKLSERKVKVEIIDTGVGISEEFQQQIFKPFLQEEQGYSRKFEGAGLGLSLVKKYAELNKIKLSFISKKHIGTSFIIEIKCD